MGRKYSDEYLMSMAKVSRSMIDMMSKMGYVNTSGSMQNHLKQRLLSAGAVLDHWVKGNTGNPSSTRLKPSEILKEISATDINRCPTKQLRRCLIEVGVPYECAIPSCLIKEWQGRPITLQIDHIDGNWRNNDLENLRFLCPNCHTQTENWGKGLRGT